jgi:adenylate cyclase
MKRLLSPWWALITLAVLVYVFMAPPKFLESVKLNYFDQLIVNQEPVENNIYVAEIDEAALEKYGQYPFPRNIYSDIIKDLYDHGAGLVVWNVMMPEPDRFGGDVELSETMMALPVILASRPSDKTKNEPINPGAVIVNDNYLDTILPYGGIIANIPVLENSSVGAGIVSQEVEIDGVVRRMPTVAVVDGVLYPSLALETLRVIAGDPNFQIKLSPFGVDKMRIPQFGTIPTDDEGRVWIDWSQTNKTVSVTDLPDDFGGAVVIVDVTAAGIANPVPTATGAVFPGNVQAAVIGTMFNGTNIQRPGWAPTAELVFLTVGGLVMILLSRWMIVGLLTTVALIGGVVPYSMMAYADEKVLLDVTAPVITFVIIALQVYGIKFVREFLEKQAIKKQFSGYCSPEVVRLLQENPDLIKKGIKKDVSVMFSDLRGFTPIGEHFDKEGNGGPAGLTKYMNGYMDAITQPILDHNGMVIKYVGDASMHIQGAPIDDDDHAFNIVETGLQMLDAVDAYTAKAEAEGLPPAAMGFGVNTGEGYIGEMGSTARHNYDILGDMVSTAARLEARCKAYGVLCIIGAETYRRTEDRFFYLFLDNLQPKGKSTPDFIYTALRVKCANAVDYDDARELHNDMHKEYKAQRFDVAIRCCKELKGKFDGQMDKYYDIWIERCELMKTQKLPKNWNGAFVATEK